MAKNKDKVYEEIDRELMSVDREGIEDLLAEMKDAGYFDAPASTRFHGAYEGALAEHSLNVLNCAKSLAKAWLGKKWLDANQDSVIICALLHDFGKCGQFGKQLYVPNILKTGQSEKQPFKTNPDLKALPHEIVSCIEVTKFIDLTEDEQRAIAWHNGLYGPFKYDIQGNEDELYMIIHFADMWASRIIEKEVVLWTFQKI